MTLQQFIDKWLNKECKVLPNTMPGQCFDLAVAFTDNLGIPHYPNNPSPFPYDNASQIYTDFGTWQGQYFDRIANSPTGVPQAGDIIVWSNAYGGVGHVAVVISGNVNQFVAFSQNDPIKSKCIQKTYNYNYVLGWLRYKGQVTQPTTQPTTDCKVYKDEIEQLKKDRSFRDAVITERDATILKQTNDLSLLQSQLNSKSLELQESQKQTDIYKSGYDQLPQLKAEKEELERQKASWIEQEKTFNRALAQYKQKLDTIKSPIKKILSQILDELKAISGSKA